MTGKVFLQNRAHPELTSGSQQYLLLVPRRLTWGLEVKEGEQVTVEGYKTTAPRWDASPDAVYLQVTKATIQGKQYDLADYLGGPRGAFGGPGQGFGRGGRGPMMGGRGAAQLRPRPGLRPRAATARTAASAEPGEGRTGPARPRAGFSFRFPAAV